jgi:hypothetical protein
MRWLLALLAMCPAAALAQPAWETYGASQTSIVCHGNPVLLTGNHTDTTLTGPCTMVRVAGEHNDVTVSVAPRAVIEITGRHNDVWWQGPVHPTLLDHGSSNTFHHKVED